MQSNSFGVIIPPMSLKVAITIERADISLGGAYIETHQPIDVGQTIDLSLSTPYFAGGCAIKSQVVWRDEKGIGITFKNTGIGKKRILQALIGKASGIKAGPDQGRFARFEAA